MSGSVYVLNIDDQEWELHSELNLARFFLTCGKVAADIGSSLKSVIVPGGQGKGGFMSSVEVLDPGSTAWRLGPELPVKIHRSTLVEDPQGGVVLVGGEAFGETFVDRLFWLPHVGPNSQWQTLPVRLNSGRFWHVSVMMPSNSFNCSTSVVLT